MQQRYEHVVDIGRDIHDDDVIDPESLAPHGIDKRRRWQSYVMIWRRHLTFFAVCIFLIFIWWLFFPVKIVSIGGKITAVPENDISLLLNNTRLGIAVLAAEASPPATLVPQNTTANNATEGHLLSLVCQNTTANNATEGHKMNLDLQNLTASNCTKALLLMSNKSQSPSVKNVTEAQLLSKPSQNIKANRVSKIHLVSKRTRNLGAKKCTVAKLLGKQTKNPKAIEKNAAQPGRSWRTKANNFAGIEAKSSASV